MDNVEISNKNILNIIGLNYARYGISWGVLGLAQDYLN